MVTQETKEAIERAMRFPRTIDDWSGACGNEFSVRQISDSHRRVIVVTRKGNVYAQTWAAECDDPELKRSDLEEIWLTDRQSWRRFDISAGAYLE